ncbi:MAG: hypothetical protein K2Y32_16745 [Candidatus Obscuribacterales bacterium]|nr:hypothetical protein [Candidatus Obscuribacterales bacterium]
MPNSFQKTLFCLFSAIVLLSSFAQKQAVAQTANSRVTTTVNVEIPVVVKLSGVDNITTVQALSLNAKNITFDSNLTASGRTFVTWRGNTNSNNGFQVTVQRSVITGTASNALQQDIMVSGQSFPGGDTDVVIASPYVEGVSLAKVSDTIPDLFCTTKGPGAANFNVQLSLAAPSTDGLGTISTILTFVAASL